MHDAEQERKLQLDLDNEVFQENWLTLDKSERSRVTDTLRKLRQLTWNQLYRDQGLKWEKGVSVKSSKVIVAVFQLSIPQSGRASAYRDGNLLRFLTIAPDHDAA